MTAPRNPQDHRPKKTAAKKPAAHFDLDALEREGERPDVFTFQHGGKTFTLGDPNEVDISDFVEEFDNPLANLSILVRLLGDEQYKALKAAGPLPNWKVPHLLEAWNEHYGVDLGKSDA